nr:hypothetical protein GCM10020241_22250 [Streptoalloteichus tenebrarius]
MRVALVPAPVGRYGPMTRQKVGSRACGKGPPELGLPSTTKNRIATPMPTSPARTWSAIVAAAVAKTMSAPNAHRPTRLSGNASSIGPTMSAPPSPETIA